MDERAKRRVLVAVMLTIFLAAIESTVVALAMPTIVASLGGLRHYSWVFSGYLLTQTVTMPLWGRFSDLYGRRPVYLAGLTTFLVGSALSGAAQDMAQLIVFRMVQGLGAGSLMTLGYTIIGEIFGLERRARLQGYLSGVWGVASMVGPPLGGLLTDHLSWRSVFYMNLPFGAVAMALVATALGGAMPARRRPVIDWRGVVCFTVGIVLVMLALVEAVTRSLAAMAMFGALAFVPLFVQAVTGASATRSGAVVAPFVLGWVALSATSARLVLRVGYRGVVMAGAACLTGAFLLLARWDSGLSMGGAMRDVLLAGGGMGLVIVPMLIAVQSAVPRSELGIATSVVQFFMSVGGAVGVSVMGAVMSQRLAAGQPLVEALHGVFVTGLVVCVAALGASLLVPPGRARDLARADMRGEPTRAGS